jgi:hypothetical protein
MRPKISWHVNWMLLVYGCNLVYIFPCETSNSLKIEIQWAEVCDLSDVMLRSSNWFWYDCLHLLEFRLSWWCKATRRVSGRGLKWEARALSETDNVTPPQSHFSPYAVGLEKINFVRQKNTGKSNSEPCCMSTASTKRSSNALRSVFLQSTSNHFDLSTFFSASVPDMTFRRI